MEMKKTRTVRIVTMIILNLVVLLIAKPANIPTVVKLATAEEDDADFDHANAQD